SADFLTADGLRRAAGGYPILANVRKVAAIAYLMGYTHWQPLPFAHDSSQVPTMIGQIMSSWVFLGALLIGIVSQPEIVAAANDLDDGKVFVGYVFRLPEKINFSLYTHLCHAFIVADEDGTIRPNRSCPSRELVADAHQAKVQVLISLGGWGWDKQFAAIVSQPEAEDRYVKAVMAIVDEYDYDGIDLDWEYPDTKEEVAGYERLC